MLTVGRFEQLNSILLNTDKRLVIALSGGLDSTVLLHLLSRCYPIDKILLWHVNHHLQSASKGMEAFCTSQADRFKIQFKSFHLDLSNVKSNIEAEARKARYSIFSGHLEVSDILLTAHHADDQTETLLLNLLRGSGVAGLRGVAEKLNIFGCECRRPLLKFSRDEIERYAIKHKLVWFEDPSNTHLCFDRNYIRHELVPKFKQRWPSFLASFVDVSRFQQEAHECLIDLAEIDFAQCSLSNEYSINAVMSLPELSRLSLARKKNVIRFWLTSVSLPLSRNEQKAVIELVLRASSGVKVMKVGEAFVATFKQCLFVVLTHEVKELPNDLEALFLQSLSNSEFLIHRANYKKYGLSSHFLKHLFQKSNIPPWLRDQTVFKIKDLESKEITDFKIF